MPCGKVGKPLFVESPGSIREYKADRCILWEDLEIINWESL